MPNSVNGVGSTGITAAATSEALKKSNVTGDQFLKLLITQLQNQDPLSPMDNEQFLTQMAQFQNLQETMEMSTNTKNLLLGQQLSAASGLIGKNVVAVTDSYSVNGKVDKVVVVDGTVKLMVGGQQFGLSDITEVTEAGKGVNG